MPARADRLIPEEKSRTQAPSTRRAVLALALGDCVDSSRVRGGPGQAIERPARGGVRSSVVGTWRSDRLEARRERVAEDAVIVLGLGEQGIDGRGPLDGGE